MTSTSKPTAKCSDLNIRWGSSGFMPLAPWSTKWTGRKTISCAQVTRNKDSARETVRKVEALRAFAAGGGRKQDNGRIVLQIFSELRVLDSWSFWDTQSKIKMKGNPAKEEENIPAFKYWYWSLSSPLQSLCVGPFSKPTLNYNSRLLVGMEWSVNL